MNRITKILNKQKAFLLSCLIWGIAVVFRMTTMHVQAAGEGDAFFVDAELAGVTDEVYEVLVSVENLGTDWDGIVRVMVHSNYRMSTAYDTRLSLPEESKKEFVVKMSKNAMQDVTGTVLVYLLDNKENVILEEEFYNLLNGGRNTVSLGILSDKYSELTYLDMGGNELYYWGDEYPVRLYEISQNNLLEKLETLQFFVIDSYNTEILTDQEVDAIRMWCEEGGILLIGTGENAEATLGGLSKRLVDVEYHSIYKPGTQGYSNQYTDEVNWSELHMADLIQRGSQNYNIMYTSAALCYNLQNGIIGVVPYSLVELGQQGEDFFADEYYWDRDVLVSGLLQDMASMTPKSHNNPYDNTYYNVADNIRSMLRAIGGKNSELNFEGLKFFVILYVVFVGPILYLLLRSIKKRELYWVAVPATVVVGVIIVFFAGKGFEVVNTRVFSVTAENLENHGKSRSYLYAYDAGIDEWNMQMQPGYSYADRLGDYSWRYSEEEGAYDCRVLKEGERLSIGIVPEQNFEDSYFMLAKNQDVKGEEGSIEGQQIYENNGTLYGTITNNTNSDFPYYAVVIGNQMFLLKNLKAGETLSLKEQVILYHNTDRDNYFGRYKYSYLQKQNKTEKKEDVSELAALGVGIYHIIPETEGDEIILLGVMPDVEKTVDDSCNEIAYKCVYQIQ